MSSPSEQAIGQEEIVSTCARLDIKRNFFPRKVGNLWIRLLREVVKSSYQEVFKEE